MRDDDFYIPKHQRDHLERLLNTEIPTIITELITTTTRMDRIGRPELTRHRRTKRPGSAEPLNFFSAGVAVELHNALVGAARLTCESRGRDYDGDPSTLGVCGWLARCVTALALTEGAEDMYYDIAGATKAAYRAVDHRPLVNHYVGTCRACESDLYARREDSLFVCQCGTTTTRLAQDARIDSALEDRNYTARELVDLVRDRLGIHIKPKAIYDLEHRKHDPIAARGYRMIQSSGRRVAMYRAGDVFDALRERQRKAS